MSELEQPKATTEAQEAANIRATLQRQLADVCATMDHANRLGFVISFGIGLGPNNRNAISALVIAKHF